MCVYLNVFVDLFGAKQKMAIFVVVFSLKLLLICFHFNLILHKRIGSCIVN